MDWKKISLYLLFAFGIAWLTALIMQLSGIEYGSMLSVIMVAIFFMPAPAYAVLIVQKLIYKEPIGENYGWSFNKQTIRFTLLGALIGASFLVGTLMVSAVLGDLLGIEGFGSVDLSEQGVKNALRGILDQMPVGDNTSLQEYIDEGFPFPNWLLLPLILVAGLFSAITFNLPFMFGEEFGWRGLLLYETRKMGLLKNTLFIGLIWGIWHAPIIAMGHNYPGHPLIGIFMMCALTIAMGIPFAYVRIRGQSILAPCVLHGMINSTANATILFLVSGHPLLGSIVGISGIIALLLISALLLILDPQFFRNFSRT